MSDWELIVASKREEDPITNDSIRYVRQNPECAYALCRLNWRDNPPMDFRAKSLLDFRWDQLCDVVQEYGSAPTIFPGAMMSWALEHRDYEVFLNGEML